MEGFKNTTKIQYFKEGGFVTKKEFTKYEKKEDKVEAAKDMVKDTKLVKSGVRQHETALHKGEPKTELKLKCGGRAKKAGGTVRKFEKASGEYGAKKTATDLKNIEDAKNFKNVPAKMCGGKSVSKYAAGGNVSVDQKLAALEQQRAMEKMARAKKYLGPAQQSELIKQSPAAAGLTPPAPAGRPAMAPSAPVADVNGMPMKKGGKAKKC